MDYQEYLNSEGWKAKRNMILNMWGNRCALCNEGGELHLHHRDYSRLGNEEVTDVIPLCKPHHARFHETSLEIEAEELHKAILIVKRQIATEQDTLQNPNHQVSLYNSLDRLYKRFIFVASGI
jgi:hypothetical protein